VATRQGRGPADSAQDLSLSTRCVHFGTPNLMAGYQSYFELTQASSTRGARLSGLKVLWFNSPA